MPKSLTNNEQMIYQNLFNIEMIKIISEMSSQFSIYSISCFYNQTRIEERDAIS